MPIDRRRDEASDHKGFVIFVIIVAFVPEREGVARGR